MKLLGQELKLPRHVGLFGLGKQLFNSLSVGQKVMTVIVVLLVLTLLLLAVARWILVLRGVVPIRPEQPPAP